jgi:hypothetical protein
MSITTRPVIIQNVNVFFSSSKSSDYFELLSTILGTYKSVIAIAASPSDDDLPKLPLQVIQLQKLPSIQKLPLQVIKF